MNYTPSLVSSAPCTGRRLTVLDTAHPNPCGWRHSVSPHRPSPHDCANEHANRWAVRRCVRSLHFVRRVAHGGPLAAKPRRTRLASQAAHGKCFRQAERGLPLLTMGHTHTRFSHYLALSLTAQRFALIKAPFHGKRIAATLHRNLHCVSVSVTRNGGFTAQSGLSGLDKRAAAW